MITALTIIAILLLVWWLLRFLPADVEARRRTVPDAPGPRVGGRIPILSTLVQQASRIIARRGEQRGCQTGGFQSPHRRSHQRDDPQLPVWSC